MRRHTWLLAIGVFLIMIGTSWAIELALQAGTPAAAAAAAAPSAFSLFLKGALGGALAALLGWSAQKKLPNGDHEDWDWHAAILTVVVGAGVGIAATFLKTDLQSLVDKTEASPLFPIFTLGFEYIVKSFGRNLFPGVTLKGIADRIKGGSGQNPTGSGQKPPGTL